MAKKFNSIEERAEAYEKVLETMRKEGISLDEAYEKHGFAPEDRLDANQLLTFTIQKEMANEFLPM